MYIQYFSGGNFFETAFYNPVIDDFDLNILSSSPTQIVAVNPGNGAVTTFTGTGFPLVPIPPLSGTLTGFSVVDGGSNPLATITGISWGLQATLTALEAAVGDGALGLLQGLLSLQDITLDASGAIDDVFGLDFGGVTSDITFIGSIFGDEFFGGSGNDSLSGGAGDDDLIGGAGSDQLVGGLGNDYLEGGLGNDTLDASADPTGFGDYVRPGLGTNTILGSQTLYQVGEDGIDISYSDVSGVGGLTILVGANGSGTVTSGIAGQVNDTFTWTHFFQGSQDADSIVVTSSSGDWFEGFSGYAGNDTIDGGTGYDDVDYRSEAREHTATAQGVVVNLATGLAIDTYGDTDTLLNIEAIRGTSLADTVTAINDANAYFSFRGYAGADVLNGTALGYERADYSRDSDDGGNLGIVADLAAGTVIDGFGFTDLVTAIDEIRGTQFNDVMTAVGTSAGIRFRGEDGNDSLRGGNGDDQLEGGNGNDTLFGGLGSDDIIGGSGNDLINPGDNTDYDYIESGAGNDTISFADLVNGFIDLGHYDLNAGIAVVINGLTNTGSINKGVNGTTTLISIANPIVAGAGPIGGLGLNGTDFNDSFTVTNTATGYIQIAGGRGQDTFTLQPGTGTIRLVYDLNDVTSGIVMNLVTGVVSNDGYGFIDTILGGNASDIRATRFADVIQGSSAAYEQFILEGGNDSLNGGGGYDIVRFDRSGVAGVNVDLATFTASGIWEGVAFTSELVDIDEVRGSREGDDTIRGDGASNVFLGRFGNDSLDGRGGNDTLDGEEGNDSLLGGSGNDSLGGGEGNDVLTGGAGADSLAGGNGARDRASYSDSATGLRADLQVAATNTGIAAGDTFSAVEDLFGSIFGDSLLGDTLANVIYGDAGNDIYLDGRIGNDTIFGGVGNDVLIGGQGADSLVGDAGTRDRVQYTDSTVGLRVDLQVSSTNTGIAAGDTFSGVEDIYGSFSADSLLGDTGANIIYADAGNDPFLDGRLGNDTIYGGAGNDVLIGGQGADLLDGGAGTRDRVQYTESAGVRADLQVSSTNSGNAAGDTYAGVEDIYGSFQTDTLLGDGGGNIIWGAAGNDVIDGRLGADTIYGGAGNDAITGGSGADVFVFDAALGATNVDTLTGYTVADDIIHLENAIFATLAAGALGAAFTTGAAATLAGHRIIYNAATGALSYDADGNGAGAAVQFATLSTGLAMVSTEFLVI